MDKDLLLINQANDKPAFYSSRWRTTTTPDLAFAIKTTMQVELQLSGKTSASLQTCTVKTNTYHKDVKKMVKQPKEAIIKSSSETIPCKRTKNYYHTG